MASITPVAIADAAEWLAHRYDAHHDAVQFVRIERAERATATFLTDEYLPKREPVSLRRADALAHMPKPAPLRFIFHSAFCCSTLLAVAFDRPGLATSYKEPQILNDLVGWRRRGARPAKVAEVLDGALMLLARTFERNEASVIKPSNIVNGLIPAVLGVQPEARAILLHAPLPVYLTSVAKKGIDGRLWVRELFLSFRSEGLVQGLGFDDQAFFGQTDLQIAAMGWLAQQALFARLLATPGISARLRSLDSETLVARPIEVVAAAAAHYGLAIDAQGVAGIVESAFRREAKSGKAFDGEDRAREHRQAGSAHADEIAKVAHWAGVVAQSAGIPLKLGKRLV
jgi:hypothetical protein